MAYLRAFGEYLPERVVTNAEMASLAGCQADWITSVSGIEERRFAADGESVADMGARAAQECLDRAGLEASELGAVIVASGSGERRFPGPACLVAHKLGLDRAPALDVPMASAGSLFALAMARDLTASLGNVLVVGAEKMSAVVLGEPVDKNVAVLFGDGAGACLVSPGEGPGRIVASVLQSDGAFAGSLRLEFGQPLAMDGRMVILQASRKLPRVIAQVLEKGARQAADVEAFLMHQANRNLIVRVAQSLGVAEEKFYTNISRYGNTSSASMLIAASEWWRENGFRPGANVVLAAFGAGFHWGAVLVEG
jgi:3-oxoacyl-[acyl-carrier-protein] synthase III